MKILTVSTLYPNNKEPKHGIFVRNRLNHLRQHFADVDAKVIAPVPWFPLRIPFGPFSEYAKFVGVAERETRDGIDVLHPRYLVIPKIGMYLTPFFLARAMKKAARQLASEGFECDVIDGHYFFPDGVAIRELAESLGKPYTVTARGTDINLIPQYPRARRWIRRVAEQAGHCMTVCKALKDSLLEFAPVGNKTTVLRNGVDLDFFQPSDEAQQRAAKQAYGVDEQTPLLVSVGHLIERKGHHLVIEALQQHPTAQLFIAGDGPQRQSLTALVDKLGLSARVTFMGALSQEDLRDLYRAADALILASSREGWANVLLEAMACGTPVVATNLWGTPEVVADPVAGVLVDRNAEAISNGITALLAAGISRQATRHYAQGFDWLSTSQGQHQIFSALIKSDVEGSKESLAC
ncbi:glycosyltransferase family 4 protein [Aestuariibacter halophilus]|uniref:Glycosyltransferase family 4 protein n=1 Tax=Fluctibacter halophilus TaxID=226011 RepID=A0ABS8G2U5_9ALTE|nr:glycosyltransferase family 4 protein [Aestuariibacter halophilus]MCC2614860.1 glycosyltransferase family 4 protein [Aestuariibacter halophilus]